MEETRKQKLRQRDERERARFNKHLYRMGGNITNASGVQLRSTDSAENYEISVQGIRFRIAKNGSKLVKVPGENIQPTAAFTLQRGLTLCCRAGLTEDRRSKRRKSHSQDGISRGG